MLAGCSSESRSGSPAPPDPGFHSYRLTAGLDCEPSHGLLECLRRNEATAAERHGVALARSGDMLCLSSPGSAETCLRKPEGFNHVFLERTAGRFVVVETDDLGGYTVLLVDAETGRRRRIDNRPWFSPGAPFFATVSYDTDAGYLPNRVVVRDSTTNAPVHEAARFAPGTGPTGIRWTAPTRLQVRYSRTEYSPEGDGGTGTFTIWRNEDGTWTDDYTR